MTMRMQAGLAAPAPARASAPAPEALDGGAWFEAGAPCGPLRLGVFGGRRARHAVDAALALHACEPLLQALQAWTGLALDWHWSVAPHARAASPAHAVAAWQPHAEVEAVVALPWALLRAVAPPPAALAERLRWSPVAARVTLSRFAIDADEAALLEPGGALVLPESMRPPWRGQLRAAGEPPTAGVPVALDAPWAPTLLRSHAAPPPAEPVAGAGGAERIACAVQVALARPVAADRCAGWLEGEPAGEVEPCAQLWRLAADGAPAQRLAVGRLMPWGDGWALAIVTDDAPAGARRDAD